MTRLVRRLINAARWRSQCTRVALDALEHAVLDDQPAATAAANQIGTWGPRGVILGLCVWVDVCRAESPEPHWLTTGTPSDAQRDPADAWAHAWITARCDGAWDRIQVLLGTIPEGHEGVPYVHAVLCLCAARTRRARADAYPVKH